MIHKKFVPKGVCSTKIEFDIDDKGKIRNLSFVGGCNGNLKAIGRLTEGQDAFLIRDLLKGNTCGFKSSSCADQLSIAIDEAIKDNLL